MVLMPFMFFYLIIIIKEYDSKINRRMMILLIVYIKFRQFNSQITVSKCRQICPLNIDIFDYFLISSLLKSLVEVLQMNQILKLNKPFFIQALPNIKGYLLLLGLNMHKDHIFPNFNIVIGEEKIEYGNQSINQFNFQNNHKTTNIGDNQYSKKIVSPDNKIWRFQKLYQTLILILFYQFVEKININSLLMNINSKALQQMSMILFILFYLIDFAFTSIIYEKKEMDFNLCQANYLLQTGLMDANHPNRQNFE